MSDQTIESQLTGPPKMTRVRWLVCVLLFFAITINYIDRQIIAVLKPTLEKQFGWDEIAYSNTVFSFQLAYAVGMAISGWLIDRIGVKAGLALAVTVWSLAAAGHGLANLVPVASGTAFFIAVRAMLGVSEAAAFPSSIRATAEWFPRKERSLCTGIFNSGSNIGPIITPLVVPILAASAWGWPSAFYVAGAIGFVWLAFWLLLYRSPDAHPKVNAAELAHIRSDPVEAQTKVPWRTLLGYRETWGFAVGKFMTDPIWWFYLFWVPDFLSKTYKLSIKEFGLPLVTIYIIADIGSIGGGWLSSRLISRGWSINAGRKTALLVCALCVTPIVFAAKTTNLWVATVLIGLAAAAHQGWSANLFTTVSDSFPRRITSSVVGLGGMVGAIGGMIFAKTVGYILKATGGQYFILFIIGAVAYLLALLFIHLLVPDLGGKNGPRSKLDLVETPAGTTPQGI